MTWQDRLLLLVLFAALFAIGYHRGWTQGVKETEARWSDAVSKSEWSRPHDHD